MMLCISALVQVRNLNSEAIYKILQYLHILLILALEHSIVLIFRQLCSSGIHKHNLCLSDFVNRGTC